VRPAAPWIDIVVPSYDGLANLDGLKRICRLRKPNSATMIIIICDRPEYTEQLREQLERFPNVRVRGNEMRKYKHLR
jgi:acyl-CoA hydrolase